LLANLFQTNSPPLIGVDISSSAVKMVEIEQAGKNLLMATS
jgi:Tfp pilus assembly PilM family ATPase